MSSRSRSEDPAETQVVVSRRLEAVGDEPVDELHETQAVEVPEPEPELPNHRRRKLVLYSAGIALISSVGLALLVSYAWYLAPDGDLTGLTESLRRYALVHTLLTMFVAGAAGGALSNLIEFLRRGQRRHGFPERLEIPLYLRPLSSAVLGVLVFFVLQFFVAVLSVGGTTQGWALLHGRLAYVAVALVIGFSVRDFERVRDVAATLLARRS